jgi:hypothetical protein
MHIKFGSKDMKGTDNSEDLGVDGKILDGSYGNRVGSCGLDSSGSG